MKKLLVISCWLLAVNVFAQNRNTIIRIGELVTPICCSFEPSKALIIVVGNDTLYNGGDFVYQKYKELFNQYENDFEKDCQADILWYVEHTREAENLFKIITKIRERKPSWEGFQRWMDCQLSKKNKELK